MATKPDGSWLILFLMGAVAFAIIGAVAGIDRGFRSAIQDMFGYGGPHSDESIGGRDLFHSGVDIRGEKGGERYFAYDARRDAEATVAFNGFGCPGSCSEHEAGYEWAKSQNVLNPGQCRGRSWAFTEGCAVFAFEREIRGA